MSLFGTARDASLIRHINRELVNNIIEQQIGYYKINLERSEYNLYGEANGTKMFNDPVLINCLIERTPPEWNTDNFGPDVTQDITCRFLKDDLAGYDEDPINYVATGYMNGGYTSTISTSYNIVPEVGDVIAWNNDYYEVDSVVENQLFVGKQPEYSFSSDNDNFGLSISIIVSAHYSRVEKLGIRLERL
jgi:hypothetical protein